MTKKLTYITNQVCGSGGLERVLSLKASYFSDVFNYEVHIITLNQEQSTLFYDFSKKIHFHNITVSGNVLTYFFKYNSKLKNLLEKIDSDIILVCDDGLKGLLLPVFYRKSCPMIYERHASKKIIDNKDHSSILDKVKYKLFFWLMDFGAKRYDAVVLLTNGNKKDWRINNVTVIPNPLSFNNNDVEFHDQREKIVLAVGNHGFQKGYDRLLKIWEKVISEHPDWKLNIFGKIDSEMKHLKLAEKLNITESINFFSPTKNIGKEYQKAAIYVMSSRSEGFGMVLIEAMSFGLPCIAFDCPHGPRDIISNGQNGFLIENGNIEEFSNAVSFFIKNEEIRLKMGLRAKKSVQRYSMQKIAGRWDNLFKELI